MATTGIRLAKRVAALLDCSRSEAEHIVVGGWVQVNGVVVDDPARRVSDEHIEVHPQAQRGSIPLLTLVLYKAENVRCDAEGPPRGASGTRGPALAPSIWQSLLPAQRSPDDRSESPVSPRQAKALRCIAPLEDAATGLVVLSEDPRIVRRLQDRQAPLESEMAAEVRGLLSPEQLARLNPPGLRTSLNHQTAQRTGLRLALKGYIPGELGAFFANQGLELLSLKRLRLGRVTLAPLQAGQWRALLPFERF